jgi:hypothetical protein
VTPSEQAPDRTSRTSQTPAADISDVCDDPPGIPSDDHRAAQVAAVARSGVPFETAWLLVTELGARVVGVTDPEMTNTEGTLNG